MGDEGAAEPVEPDEATLDARFMQLFDVSRAELREQGIDPEVYTRAHIHKAMKDRRRWPGIIPHSLQYAILWTRWGWRGYVALFATAGCLFATKIPGLRWYAADASFVPFACAIVCLGLMFYYRYWYVQACRAEGVPIVWRPKAATKNVSPP